MPCSALLLRTMQRGHDKPPGASAAGHLFHIRISRGIYPPGDFLLKGFPCSGQGGRGVPPAPAGSSPIGPLTRRQEEGASYASLLQPDPPHAGGREPPLHLSLGHHRTRDGAGQAVALVNQHLHLHRNASVSGKEPLVRPLHAGGGKAPEEPHGLHASVAPAVRGVRAQVQLPAAVRPVVRTRLEEAAPLIGRHSPQGHRLPRAQPRHLCLHSLVRQASGRGNSHAHSPPPRGQGWRWGAAEGLPDRGQSGHSHRSPHVDGRWEGAAAPTAITVAPPPPPPGGLNREQSRTAPAAAAVRRTRSAPRPFRLRAA